MPKRVNRGPMVAYYTGCHPIFSNIYYVIRCAYFNHKSASISYYFGVINDTDNVLEGDLLSIRCLVVANSIIEGSMEGPLRWYHLMTFIPLLYIPQC